jgi:hypothetical protein
MKKNFSGFWSRVLGLWAAGSVLMVQAFPPAPPAVVYGLVRDELGDPVVPGAGSVLFDSGTGVTNSAAIVSQTAANGNYTVSISMDSGVTGDAYKATALMPAAGFRLKVVMANKVYLPIEMQGNLATLGQPGSKTRLDLTLGVSSDNDGLPDAWKRAIIQQLGLGLTPGQIHPGDLVPGTGLTFYQIYIAGTYYLAQTNGFALTINGHDEQVSRFSFTGVKGRSYLVQSGPTLDQLSLVGFQINANGVRGPVVTRYLATNTAVLNIEVPNTLATDPAAGFFRLIAE